MWADNARPAPARQILLLLALFLTLSMLRIYFERPKVAVVDDSLESKIRAGLDHVAAGVTGEAGENNVEATARQVLIAGFARSGTSFLADLVKAFPGSYYSFEPLMLFSGKTLSTFQDQLTLLKAVLTCNFGSDVAKDYLRFLQEHKACEEEELCYSWQFQQRACSLLPVKVVKTVRVESLDQVEPLLQDSDLAELRVISLVRDPRAVKQSQVETFCSLHNRKAHPELCLDVETFCQNYGRNIRASMELARKHPKKVLLLRYEDLATEPSAEARKVFSFLDLPVVASIIDFVKSHTDLEEKENRYKDPYGTVRFDSGATASQWRLTARFADAFAIQQTCREPMEAMGYRLFGSNQDLKNISGLEAFVSPRY